MFVKFSARDRMERVPPTTSGVKLIRKFVETGDERCPLAGLWAQVMQNESADESESTWPVVGFFRPPRAVLRLLRLPK